MQANGATLGTMGEGGLLKILFRFGGVAAGAVAVFGIQGVASRLGLDSAFPDSLVMSILSALGFIWFGAVVGVMIDHWLRGASANPEHAKLAAALREHCLDVRARYALLRAEPASSERDARIEAFYGHEMKELGQFRTRLSNRQIDTEHFGRIPPVNNGPCHGLPDALDDYIEIAAYLSDGNLGAARKLAKSRLALGEPKFDSAPAQQG